MSYGKTGRKIYTAAGRKMNAAVAVAPIHAMNQAQFTGAIRSALIIAFRNDRSPVKRIADLAGSNINAAKNWWEGRCAPNGLYLSRLRASVPELDAEIRRLEAMEASLDPNFQQALSQFISQWGRK